MTRTRSKASTGVATMLGTLLCCALLPACSSSAEPPKAGGPAADPVSIAVLGSSTAAGFGLADPATSWVALYTAHLEATRPGSRLTNLAVSGYTTFQVLPTGTTNPSDRPVVDSQHNVSAALELAPGLIIVNLPSNDAAFGFPVDETLQNLHAVATLAESSGITVWVCTSQPRQLPSSGLALLIELRDRTLQDFAPHTIDFWTPLAAPDGTPLPEFNTGDGIHPNADGHRLLFEQVVLADAPASVD